MWARIKQIEEVICQSVNKEDADFYQTVLNKAFKFYEDLTYSTVDMQQKLLMAKNAEKLLNALKSKRKNTTKESIAEELELVLQIECLRMPAKDWLFPDTGPFRRELYPKHVSFMDKGANYRQRASIAANRVGKTLSALYEIVCHLTGEYPTWWQGKRFKYATNIWVCSETAKFVRDGVQKGLFGPVGAWGTGLIPSEYVDMSLISKSSGNISGAIDQARIKRPDGTFSTLTFKTYEQGRENFQGDAVHVVLLDEEPPLDIYSESLLRTMTVDGILLMTFTPLRGVTDLILNFLPDGIVHEGSDEATSRYLVNITWDDVPHLTDEMKRMMLATLAPHERLARSRGIPYIGAGLVYQFIPDDVVVQPFKIPDYYPRAYGMDTGRKVTALVFGAWDRDRDILYIYDELYLKDQTIPEKVPVILSRTAKYIPGIADHAGADQNTGTQYFAQYKKHLDIVKCTKGANSLEAGVEEVRAMMVEGRLKIFPQCTNLIAEFQAYKRGDDGKIAKGQADHALDALRYLVKRFKVIARTRSSNNGSNVVNLVQTKHYW
jgi:phage terminase large subunit-like protein/dsDNA-binding SOS-regulon protein